MGARPPFAGATPTTSFDLLLAVGVALGLPWLNLALPRATGGALASLIVYYGLCGALLYRWRLGSLDYGRPRRWPWAWFGVGIALAARAAGALLDRAVPLMPRSP
ncbi:MAG: hypothetical protein OHK0015_40730 [Chloroflexi bacterium OHK40]